MSFAYVLPQHSLLHSNMWCAAGNCFFLMIFFVWFFLHYDATSTHPRPVLDRIQYLCFFKIRKYSKNITPTKNRASLCIDWRCPDSCTGIGPDTNISTSPCTLTKSPDTQAENQCQYRYIMIGINIPIFLLHFTFQVKSLFHVQEAEGKSNFLF